VRVKTVRRGSPFVTLALPCLLLLTMQLPTRASAQAAPTWLTSEPDKAPSQAVQPGVLPTLAAVVPGVLVHGAGSYVARDRRTAKRLLLAGAAGLGVFLASGVVIAATGTSRRLIGAFAPILFVGTGLFFTSWLADIYAASTGGREASGASFAPRMEWELGYRYVYDPQFSYRNFAFTRGDLRHESFRVSPSAWVALDDNNQRLALELARRLRGRRANVESRDQSYFDVTTALLYHRYGSERFAVWTPTLALEGRLDLAHVGHSLRGAFVEGQLGAGLELYNFDAPGAQLRDDAFGLLLARFAFGIYLGSGSRRAGELSVYYDHRHDDFAAGLGVAGIGSGVLGHLGGNGSYYFDRHWGVSALLEVGAAVVTGISARYRFDPPAETGAGT
jgi:hypothetical protein